MYVQRFDENHKDRFVSEGIKTVKDDLKNLAEDARNLAFRAEMLGLREGHDPNELLEPGEKCLSREGQDLFNQVKGALTNGKVKVNENGQAPADGYNTEMVDGRPVIASTRGVDGDRSAIVYRLANGEVLYVMHRCGNIVTENPGPNPEPTPTPTNPTPTPTPQPTCPPDMPHGTWPVCKDDPSNQPDGDNPDGNHPGGHNDTDGPGDPNPEPTFPSTPHTNPPAPTPSSIPDDSTPAPTNQPTPDPEPSSNPSDGSGNDGDPGGF
jgi:hypothetical protein